MVINAVNDITGLYFEYSTYKKNKDERYKEVFNEIREKTANFKFTSLFKEKLTNKIENITNLITKLERLENLLKSLNIPKKVLVTELKDNFKNLDFIDKYIQESKQMKC